MEQARRADWVKIRGKMRPSIEYLKSLPTIPCEDAVEGWELKMVSECYGLRYWLGVYSGDQGGFGEAACVDFQPKGSTEWVQCDYYVHENYNTEKECEN